MRHTHTLPFSLAFHPPTRPALTGFLLFSCVNPLFFLSHSLHALLLNPTFFFFFRCTNFFTPVLPSLIFFISSAAFIPGPCSCSCPCTITIHRQLTLLRYCLEDHGPTKQGTAFLDECCPQRPRDPPSYPIPLIFTVSVDQKSCCMYVQYV